MAGPDVIALNRRNHFSMNVEFQSQEQLNIPNVPPPSVPPVTDPNLSTRVQPPKPTLGSSQDSRTIVTNNPSTQQLQQNLQSQVAPSLKDIKAGKDTLQPGETGTAVPKVRDQLRGTGLADVPPGSNLTYDQDTAAGISQFQLKNGLEGTGVVDAKTLESLQNAKPQVTNFDQPAVGSYTQLGEAGADTNLQVGQRGQVVRNAQNLLNEAEAKYYEQFKVPPEQRVTPLEEDGLYGRDTELANNRFRQRLGLEPTGEIDQKTYERMQAIAEGREQYPLVTEPPRGTNTPNSTPVDPKATTPTVVDPNNPNASPVDPKLTTPTAVEPKATTPPAVDPKATGQDTGNNSGGSISPSGSLDQVNRDLASKKQELAGLEGRQLSTTQQENRKALEQEIKRLEEARGPLERLSGAAEYNRSPSTALAQQKTLTDELATNQKAYDRALASGDPGEIAIAEGKLLDTKGRLSTLNKTIDAGDSYTRATGTLTDLQSGKKVDENQLRTDLRRAGLSDGEVGRLIEFYRPTSSPTTGTPTRKADTPPGEISLARSRANEIDQQLAGFQNRQLSTTQRERQAALQKEREALNQQIAGLEVLSGAAEYNRSPSTLSTEQKRLSAEADALTRAYKDQLLRSYGNDQDPPVKVAYGKLLEAQRQLEGINREIDRGSSYTSATKALQNLAAGQQVDQKLLSRDLQRSGLSEQQAEAVIAYYQGLAK